MNRALGITLVLVFGLATVAFARPVDNTGTLDKFYFEDYQRPAGDNLNATGLGVFGAAQAGTTFFGGTFWASDSMRWEAIIDSTWTFDTGVGSHFVHSGPNAPAGINPFKDPTLHAQMEGWVGWDVSYGGANGEARRVRDTTGEARWEGTTCEVGQGVDVTWGNWSWWFGLFPGEARALCYAGGKGYGNSWNICVGQSFNAIATSGTLTYSYQNDTEPGFDFSYVRIDTTGNGNADDVIIRAFDGVSEANGVVENLTAGTDWPTGPYPKPIVVKFCFIADGAYSDEDGLDPSTCGAFSFDNVSLTGVDMTGKDPMPHTFESSANGWSRLTAEAGQGGDWSNIVAVADLPDPLTPCDCSLADSLLYFEDTTIPGHNLFTDNMAISPWIDLLANSQVGRPGKFVKADRYTDMPLLNYIFAQINVQWYPSLCAATGKLVMSPWTSDGFVIYFGDVPACTAPNGAGVFRRNYGTFIDADAEQLRFAIGVISYCRFFSNCTGITNSTPWYDNIQFALFGTPGAPLLNSSTVDVPQDAFPENGTLRIDAPGRLDSNNVKGFASPEIGSSLGDTLIVEGASANEVYVEFAIDPGPGINTSRLNTWLGSFAKSTQGMHHNGNSDGGRNQFWYRARMDTAEQGGIVNEGVWMTAFIEGSAGFVASGATSDSDNDPNDLGPDGQTDRLLADMFYDDLFTPGTRLDIFFAGKFTGGLSEFDFPNGATTLNNYLEWECLPSSMAPDSTFNCLLYVDHFSGRGAQPFIEDALATILPGTSANYEQTAWDRWDVEAPSSQQGSLGRPINTEYGATTNQILGYKAILWDSGNLEAFNLVKEDADILIPWLTLVDFQDNNLYLSGTGVAHSMDAEFNSDPSAKVLLNDYLGVFYVCSTYRNQGCPSGTTRNLATCVDVNVASTAIMSTRPLGTLPQAEGNGCPALRSYDVLALNTDTFFPSATERVEEYYNPTGKGVVGEGIVASISVDNTGATPRYRSVVDGLGVHYRRPASDCVFTPATGNDVEEVEDRLREVLGYFGYLSGTGGCRDLTATIDVPVDGPKPTFRTTLANIAPNPLLSGQTGRIQFTMAAKGQAKVEVFDVNGRLVKSVFDGIAKEGPNEAFWDGTDGASRPVASGVYFYRLDTVANKLSKKMVVVRNGN